MGLARTIRSHADLAALRAEDAEQPFWASSRSVSDNVDMVFVVPGTCRLDGEPDMPGCVALLAESQGCRLPSAAGAQLPAVESLGCAVGTIRDGDLVLVDATRGEVLVDPTDRAVSAFQAKLTGLNPTRRFFVDYAHETVRTPDGRPIVVAGQVEQHAVSAGFESARVGLAGPLFLSTGPRGPAPRASGAPDLEDAIAHGPDMIVLAVGCDCDLVGEAVAGAHGKPLLFHVHPEGCCEKALVQAAAWADVTAAISIRGATRCGSDFGAAIERATEELIEEGVETGRVRVAGWVHEGDGDPDTFAECRIERLLVSLASRTADETTSLMTPWLEDALAATRSVAVPVYCVLGDSLAHLAPDIVEAGFGGVVAPVAEVQTWKAALRNAVWPVEPVP